MKSLNKLIKQTSNTNRQTEQFKRVPAIVMTYDDSTYLATLQLITMNNSEIALLNKTGEILTVGDSVWVYYWTNIGCGVVGLRNGIP